MRSNRTNGSELWAKLWNWVWFCAFECIALAGAQMGRLNSIGKDACSNGAHVQAQIKTREPNQDPQSVGVLLCSFWSGVSCCLNGVIGHIGACQLCLEFAQCLSRNAWGLFMVYQISSSRSSGDNSLVDWEERPWFLLQIANQVKKWVCLEWSRLVVCLKRTTHTCRIGRCKMVMCKGQSEVKSSQVKSSGGFSRLLSFCACLGPK